MAMEVSSNMLHSQYASGNIGFHYRALNPPITHLAFADDVLVFFDGANQSLWGIREVMSRFKYISGLSMNIQKSALYVVGVQDEEMQTLMEHGFRIGTFPFRYLGLPLMNRKLRINEYSPLLDALHRRFSSWQVKKISYAGRLQLLKSVIGSLINFWGAAYCFPKGCVKKIEQLCQRFLWSGQTEEICSHKVAWAEVCKPRDMGGLGLRNIQLWNKTLLLKLPWRSKTANDSLWVQWVKVNYLKNDSIWTVTKRVTDSWVWNSILSLRPLVIRFLSSSIRSGKDTSFWYDRWASSTPLVEICGEVGFVQLGIPKSATVADANDAGIWTRLRRRGRLRNHNLNRVLDSVAAQSAPAGTNDSDIWSWSIESHICRKFTTKYTWETLQIAFLWPRWSRVIWFKGHVPRYAFISWLEMLNRLPTMEKLNAWGCALSSICCLCNKYPESREHLFLHCESVEKIWWFVTKKLGGYYFLINDWESLISWMISGTPGVAKTLLRLTAQITIYHIWFARNSKMYGQSQLAPDLVINKIDRAVRDVVLARKYRASFQGLLQQWFQWD